MSETVEKLPLWMKTESAPRRSRWDKMLSRLVRPRPARQGVFGFVERAERVDRAFKIAIAVLTIGGVAAGRCQARA